MKKLQDVFITMRDGIRISADIYLPDKPGSYPALFSMSPYGKEAQVFPGGLFTHTEAGDVEYFVNKGYAWIIADSRGKHPSEGQYNLLDKKEQRDGYELVEWTARQPWCNGSVAGMGMSYFSMINYLIAALQPPSLKALVTIGGSFDFYRDVVYMGGLYHSGFLERWFSSVTGHCFPPEGTDPSAKWKTPRNLLVDTMKHSTDDSYYAERSFSTRCEKVKVPVYQIIGPSTLTHRRLLKAFEVLNVPKKLLIGTGSAWGFLFNESVKLEIGRWLDYWMQGKDTGIMQEPPVIMYVPGTDEWRYEENYPLERTKWIEFYLHTRGNNPASKPPYGLLSQNKPGEEKPDSYSWPESQRKVEANLPSLAFATPPLQKDTEIIGPASLVLYASSSTDDTAWMVKLDDEASDGSITVVGFGWLKASHRELDIKKSMPGRPFHMHKNPLPIEPGKIYEYVIEIWPIIHTFQSGHRIRLRIASSDSYVLDRMISVTLKPERHTVNTIYHDKQYPSHLILPLVMPRKSPIKLRPKIIYKHDPQAVSLWLPFHRIDRKR